MPKTFVAMKSFFAAGAFYACWGMAWTIFALIDDWQQLLYSMISDTITFTIWMCMRFYLPFAPYIYHILLYIVAWAVRLFGLHWGYGGLLVQCQKWILVTLG